jgi:hypothetical protein
MLARVVQALLPFLMHVRDSLRTGKWADWRVYAKALVGAAVAAGGTLTTALVDDTVTSAEWWMVGLAAATAFGAVWSTPNKKL